MIYLIKIKGEEKCKIGYSGNPKNRLSSLQTSSPHDIFLVSVMDGDMEKEKEIIDSHKQILSLEQIALKIQSGPLVFCNIFVEDNKIVIEEDFERSESQNNDDDCCDVARNNGEIVVEDFPMLEVSNIYSHRHKYAIVELKFKHDKT